MGLHVQRLPVPGDECPPGAGRAPFSGKCPAWRQKGGGQSPSCICRFSSAFSSKYSTSQTGMLRVCVLSALGVAGHQTSSAKSALPWTGRWAGELPGGSRMEVVEVERGIVLLGWARTKPERRRGLAGVETSPGVGGTVWRPLVLMPDTPSLARARRLCSPRGQRVLRLGPIWVGGP